MACFPPLGHEKRRSAARCFHEQGRKLPGQNRTTGSTGLAVKRETVNRKVPENEVKSSRLSTGISISRREHYIPRREHYISRREHYISRRELQIALQAWKDYTWLFRTFLFTVSGFVFPPVPCGHYTPFAGHPEN